MNSLYLNKINVVNYKNILIGEYELDRKINCFVGNNGIGKTNLLDSIYHLSAGKSYFNSISSQTINHDQDFMFIDGDFIKNDTQENIICSLKRGKKKTLKRNGKIYKKLSEHVGLIPLVMISPSDRDLIQEGSLNLIKAVDRIDWETIRITEDKEKTLKILDKILNGQTPEPGSYRGRINNEPENNRKTLVDLKNA